MDRHGIQATKIQTPRLNPDDVVNPDVYKGAFTTYFVSHALGDTPRTRQGRTPNPENASRFLSGLMTKHARHCSEAVGAEPRGTIARKLGVRGTPLQEPNTQHAEPSKHVAGATLNGQLAPLFLS